MNDQIIKGIFALFLLIIFSVFAVSLLASIDSSNIEGTPYESTWNWTVVTSNGTLTLTPIIGFLVGVSMFAAAIGGIYILIKNSGGNSRRRRRR